VKKLEQEKQAREEEKASIKAKILDDLRNP